MQMDGSMLKPTAGKGALAVPIGVTLLLVLDTQRLDKTVQDAKGFHSGISGLMVVQNDLDMTEEKHV